MKLFLRLFLFTFLMLAASGLFSQTFTITEIDPSAFPRVRAGFIALDPSGNSYKDLTKSDFTVIENSQNVNASLEIECIDSLIDPCISVLLVLDKSGSMDSVLNSKTKEKRWDWVKQGATAFLRALKFNNCTHAALVTFAFDVQRKTVWCDSAQPIIDSLEKIRPAGGTDYNPVFLDWQQGATRYFEGQPPGNRRIIIFLTDGNPLRLVKLDSIIGELSSYNVQVYSITVGMPMNPDLDAISKNTGGLAYAVYTKEQLEDIYRTIANDIQKKVFCFLTWVSKFGCDEASRTRNVDITLKKIPSPGNFYNKTYTAPPNSVAELRTSESYVIVPDPPAPNNTKSIVLTAMQTGFHVESVKVLPVTMEPYFVVDPADVGPFDIDSGASRTIKVTYNPGSSPQYRKAQLAVNSTPCPPQITLVAGLTNIKIIHPNGDELLSSCDTIDIVWAGVNKNTPVSLFYSTNSGVNWTLIKDNCTGYIYKWVNPPTGTNLRIRGVVSSTSSYIWAKSSGGTGSDGATSVAVCDNNINIYTCGYFEGTANFGSTSVSSKGGSDIYIARNYSDGNVAGVLTAGGPGNDSALAVCVTPDCGSYITGVCYQGAEFGTQSPNMAVAGVPYVFIARYGSNFANPTSIRVIGATDITRDFKIRGLKIKYSGGKVIVQGEYIGGYLQTAEYTFQKAATKKRFTVTLNDDLSGPFVEIPGINYPDYSDTTDTDADGNRYSVGTYSATIKRGPFTMTSAGKTDGFITKFGSTPGSADTSDKDFRIDSPKLTLKATAVDVGSSILGHQKIAQFEAILCNEGTITVKISDKKFNGSNPEDFGFDAEPPSEIKPGECINFVISFIPQDIGYRTSMLTISGTCGELVSLTLNGKGVCTAEVMPEYSFGNVAINVNKSRKIEEILRNINLVEGTQLTISPVIIQGSLTTPGEYLPNEFRIDSTGPTTIGPDGTIWISVSFKPQSAGTRKAFLSYQLPGECEQPMTLLTGEGIDTNLYVDELDFSARRVGSKNDSFFVVTNKTVTTQKITGIDLPASAFKLAGTYPALPFDLNANDTLRIPVSFLPDAEILFKNTVVITVEDFPSQLRGDALGIGSIPKLETNWICGTPIKPGEKNTGQIIVSNTDDYLPLFISKMDFDIKNGEFSWKNDLPFPSNITIDKNSSKTFDVEFSPKGSGIRNETIRFTADNVPGLEPVALHDTLVEVKCEALGLSTVANFDMGNVLVCDEYNQELRIFNNGWQTPVTVTGYRFDNADSTAFSFKIVGNPIIQPGSYKDFTVTFKPDQPRDYTTKLTIFNSENIEVSTILKGSGKVLNLYTDNKEYRFKPGTYFVMPVKMKMPAMSNPVLTEMTVQIEFDNQICYFLDEPGTFTSSLSNWTWNPPVQLGYGLIEVKGSGTLNTPYDGEIFSIGMKASLSDKKEAPILFHPIHKPCPTPDTTATIVKLSDICFLTGRLVTFSSTNYSLMAPQPNPASGSTKIAFGVGLDVQTTISVYNSMGALVMNLVDQKLTPGQYDLNLSVDNLPSGVYMLKMVSGPYTGQERLVISK